MPACRAITGAAPRCTIPPSNPSSEDEFTGLVALNLGDTIADITFIAYAADGTELQRVTRTGLEPNTKSTHVLRELFSAETLDDGAWVKAGGKRL